MPVFEDHFGLNIEIRFNRKGVLQFRDIGMRTKWRNVVEGEGFYTDEIEDMRNVLYNAQFDEVLENL